MNRDKKLMNYRISPATRLLCCWFGLLSFEWIINAQDRPQAPALRGIISWPGAEFALLEDTNPPSRFLRNFVLGPGQREGEIEVVELHPGSVKVHLGASGQELELSLPTSGQDLASQPAGTRNPCFVHLENARLNLVLTVYQKLAGRTLLRPSRLPDVELTIAPTNTNSKFALLRVLDTGLAEKGVLIQPHRDKFATVATRASDMEKIKPELWDLMAGLGAPGGPPNQSDEIPPGMINFPNTDLSQVLRVFEELLGLSIVRPSTLPLYTFTLRTETALTRTETKYAFAATLALNDISMLPAGDKFLLLFPTIQAQQMSNVLARIKPRVTSTNSPIAAGTIKFPRTQLEIVARLYEQLLGQKVEVAPSTPSPVLSFQNQSALSKEDVLYGIELLLGVNGLSVVPQENGLGVKIVPTGLVGR